VVGPREGTRVRERGALGARQQRQQLGAWRDVEIVRRLRLIGIASGSGEQALLFFLPISSPLALSHLLLLLPPLFCSGPAKAARRERSTRSTAVDGPA